MIDAPLYPRSKAVRAAVAAARQDGVERLGFIFGSGLLAAAMIVFVASIVLDRLG